MTINELYKFVQYVSNKEQRGFIKPSEFDMLAKRAQLDLIKDRVGRSSSASKDEGYKVTSSLYDEINPLIMHVANASYSSNKWSLPADYLYFLDASLGENGEENHFPVEIVGHGELMSRLQSRLVGPTIENPIGIMVNNGIKVWTLNANNQVVEATGTFYSLNLSYIRVPANPNWSYITVNDIEVYEGASSTELELTESTHMEVAHRILTYVGVNLREAEMVQYSAAITKE